MRLMTGHFYCVVASIGFYKKLSNIKFEFRNTKMLTWDYAHWIRLSLHRKS